MIFDPTLVDPEVATMLDAQVSWFIRNWNSLRSFIFRLDHNHLMLHSNRNDNSNRISITFKPIDCLWL